VGAHGLPEKGLPGQGRHNKKAAWTAETVGTSDDIFFPSHLFSLGYRFNPPFTKSIMIFYRIQQ
jgi:hypothetical protein